MFAAFLFTTLTVIGIIRPALLVWWSPVKSRRAVFMTYGVIAAIAITVSLISAGGTYQVPKNTQGTLRENPE